MTKILFITQHFQIGGVEKSLIEVIKCLSPVEFDITIRCVNPTGPLRSEIPSYCKVEAMDYIPLSLTDVWGKLKKGELCLAWKGLVCRLKQIGLDSTAEKLRVVSRSIPVDDEPYDYAIAFDAPCSLQVIYTLENIKAKFKYCWIHFDIKHPGSRGYEKEWHEVFKRFDKLICVSKSAEASLLEYFPDFSGKSCIVNNMVDIDYIRRLAQDPVYVDKKDGETIICTAGRLSRDKGHLLSLDVCKRMADAGREFRWFVVGEGKDRRLIECKIAELGMQNRFILLGGQLNPYKFIHGADIYVQPSKMEGQCITLLEARALGKPIICTDFQSAYEQIKDGHSGRIVSYDANELYDAICYMIDHPTERERLASNVEPPNSDDVIRQLETLF